MGDWLDEIINDDSNGGVRTRPPGLMSRQRSVPPTSPPPGPDETAPKNKEEDPANPAPQTRVVLVGNMFHSWGGLSWLAVWTLLLTWVISPLTLVALYEAISGQEFTKGGTDWSLFRGVSAWFADTMAELWIAGEMERALTAAIFSAGAVWLLDRRSRLGLRIGIAIVAVYLGGTWYAQNYSWYPDWAAWSGDWTDVQLTALLATASMGALSLWKLWQSYENWASIPRKKVLPWILPIAAVVYGLLMTSTNAAF